MSLVDLTLEVHARLAAADVPHAFGGALALGYVADPRGTLDVDVNVFVDVPGVEAVLQALAPTGLAPERDRDEWMPASGIRLRRGDEPFAVDLFPSLDERYEQVERRVVVHPFGPSAVPLPFLSAEDLTVFKLSFGRDKDWVDLAAVARSNPDLDVDYVEEQVLALRGPTMHPRLARLRSLLAR